MKTAKSTEHEIGKNSTPSNNINLTGYDDFIYEPTQSSFGGTGFYIHSRINYNITNVYRYLCLVLVQYLNYDQSYSISSLFTPLHLFTLCLLVLPSFLLFRLSIL